jgi:glycosyltransferase involved in cell wall biosynthesis
MRILLVNDYATPAAGAEITLKALRDGLRQRGHEVRVFSSRAQLIPGPSFADDSCFGTNSTLQVASSTVNISARRSLARVLEEFRPDVVHVKMFLWQLSPLILGPLRRFRSVYHVVIYKPICPTGWKMLPDGNRCDSAPGRVCLQSRCMTPQTWAIMMLQHNLFRRGMGAFDALVTTSQVMKERLEAEGVGPCRIIPNGCEERQPRPPLGDEPRLAYAGRLSPEKGIGTLLHAFKRVLERVSEARLRIVGDGPQRAGLERVAGQLGIGGKVEFVGPMQAAEMERKLESAWVQAIPSKWEEPFGMVAIEAMMRGTAVVASNSGGLRDIVRDGVTGLLIVPGDVEVWSKALTRMLTDRHLCEVMGTAGREVALEEYTVERAVDRVVSLHAELAGKAKWV